MLVDLIDNVFENESETTIIDSLTFENRIDRVSIFGSIDITRDKIGLNNIRYLKKQIDLITGKLEGENLPDEIEIAEIKVVKNPFK